MYCLCVNLETNDADCVVNDFPFQFRKLNVYANELMSYKKPILHYVLLAFSSSLLCGRALWVCDVNNEHLWSSRPDFTQVSSYQF